MLILAAFLLEKSVMYTPQENDLCPPKKVVQKNWIHKRMYIFKVGKNTIYMF